VDLEHGAIGLETMTDIFRTIDAFDCVPVARLPLNDPIWIHRSLDSGARGLIIPMVNTADEAEHALRMAKYPPRGERGFGYSRASMHGMDFKKSISTANDEIAIIMQIEHKKGIENLESILRIPDVDGVFIGPLDLSGSYGKTGQMDSPEMVGALGTYLECCKKMNKAAGMHIVRPDEKNINDAIDKGYSLIALGLDNVFLDVGATNALQAAGR
jgi:2-keto-3-deoxy-L-rhamnonate aldolase RhmA